MSQLATVGFVFTFVAVTVPIDGTMVGFAGLSICTVNVFESVPIATPSTIVVSVAVAVPLVVVGN